MSAELERIKKLITNDQLIAAVELPTHHNSKGIVVDDLEEVLSKFDEDVDYAHFVIRVKRSQTPLSKIEASPATEQSENFSIDSMVNETLNIIEEKTKATEEFDAEFLKENAMLLEQNGDHALARNIYQALIRKGFEIHQNLARIAASYELQNELSKAIRSYQEAIAYASELPYFQKLAALQIRMGNDADAAQTILHALGISNLSDAERFEMHKSLGNCYTRLANYQKAEHHYAKAYDIEPNSDILHVNVGSLALQKGDLASAETHFKRALEIESKNDRATSGLGMVFLNQKKIVEAHHHFEESLNINPNNLGTIYNLVRCAYEIRKFDTAAKYLKAYIEKNTANNNILYSLAGILFHQGSYSESLTFIDQILSSEPAHSGAKELKELINVKMNSQDGKQG